MFRNAIKQVRKYSTNTRNYEEINIPVPWGHLSAKWWEPSDRKPILALHGWQDNSSTFDRLVPLLNLNQGILAIDLPGHGLSSKLPVGFHYDNMNYPFLMRRIIKYFNWSSVRLMGHSLGAVSCYIYSMLYPEEIDYLILIDALKPQSKLHNQRKMAKGIEEYLKYDTLVQSENEPPAYTLEELKKRVAVSGRNSIDEKYAEIILKRNIAPSGIHPNKYYVTRDPRLKSGFVINWSQEELIRYCKNFTFPICYIKATKSPYHDNEKDIFEMIDLLKKKSEDFQYHVVKGTHHLHLNTPEAISGILNNFLKKHDHIDRNIQEVNDYFS